MDTSLDSRAATADLAACLRGVLEAARPVELTLIGSHRDDAVEIAEQVEQIARAVHHLQLMAALAVDTAAPAPSGVGALVLHQGGAEVGEDCTPERGQDASPSPFRRGCDLLRVRLRISGSEARRRIRTAQAVLPARALTGEITTAALPTLGALISSSQEVQEPTGADGGSSELGDSAACDSSACDSSIGAEAISVILRTLVRAAEVSPPEVVASIEQTMVFYARTFDPDMLGKIGVRVLAHVDPDGHEPTEREAKARQGVRLGATWKGLTHLDIWADPVQVETLMAVFDTGSNPRSGVIVGTESESEPSPAAAAIQQQLPDRRSREQLMLDALIAACGAALRVGGMSTVAGLPAQVMVTVALKDLQGDLNNKSTHLTLTEEPTAEGSDQSAPPKQSSGPPHVAPPLSHLSGTAHLPHAGPIPVRLIRRFACDADVIPVVLGSPSQILDVGRATRLAPAHLRKALIARDHGCVFPGCAIPATWTEAHHIKAWYDGGATALENMVLLCPHHHHAIHTGEWVIAGTGSFFAITPPWASMPQLTRGADHQIA